MKNIIDLPRIARLFAGLFLYAVGIVMTIKADIGLAPWDVLHQGLAMRIGLTFGVTSIIVSFALVAIVWVMKEYVGFGTLCNMLFIGLFIDVIMYFKLMPKPHTLFGSVLMVIGGLFVIALACVCYMGANYGAGPRDSFMVLLSRRTGFSMGFCRGATEAVVLAAGWLLGGPVGLGTIITVAGVGIAIQIVFRALRFDTDSVR